MVPDIYFLMMEALMEAELAQSEGEVPVGAVLADPGGRILTRGHNQTIALHDPTAHAEILAMRRAGQAIENYRLTGSILVVTIEPCPMCMGAAIHGRIARLVFGAHDPKSGAAGSVYDLGEDERLNHRIKVTSGILEEACRALMKGFFKARR